MRDHLWIALWAICISVVVLIGALSGQRTLRSGEVSPTGLIFTGGEFAVIAAETCLLLIAATLVRNRQQKTRVLTYFAVFALLGTLFFGGARSSGPGFAWHFVGLVASACVTLAVAAALVVRSRRRNVV